MVTRGFLGKRPPNSSTPLPPGQHEVGNFPVLSAGPTPKTALESWSFGLEYAGRRLAQWNWEQFQKLPQTTQTVDIHCVTKWSKVGTTWEGVTIDALLNAAGITPPAPFVMALCDGGYTTNVPVSDLLDTKGMIALRYDHATLSPEHGGPARLLVPHLYFWKSAKWVRGLRFMDADEPGLWEAAGYHMYGDPWREQRYAGD